MPSVTAVLLETASSGPPVFPHPSAKLPALQKGVNNQFNYMTTDQEMLVIGIKSQIHVIDKLNYAGPYLHFD